MHSSFSIVYTKIEGIIHMEVNKQNDNGLYQTYITMIPEMRKKNIFGFVRKPSDSLVNNQLEFITRYDNCINNSDDFVGGKIT